MENIESIKNVLERSEKMLTDSSCNGGHHAETAPESENNKQTFWRMILSDERAYLKSLTKRLKSLAEHVDNPFLQQSAQFSMDEMESMMKFFPFLCDLIGGDEDDDDSYYVGISGLSDVIDEIVDVAQIEATFLLRENRKPESDQIYDRSKFLRDRLQDLQSKRITDNPQDVYNQIKIVFTEMAKFEHFMLDSQKRFSVNYANVINYNY